MGSSSLVIFSALSIIFLAQLASASCSLDVNLINHKSGLSRECKQNRNCCQMWVASVASRQLVCYVKS